MRIRVKGAAESYATERSDAQKNLDAMLAAKSLSEFDKACADAGITIPSRDHLPFAYVAYPINKEHYAVAIVGMNASTYDVFPLFSYSLLAGVPLTSLKLLNEISTLPTVKSCLIYSKDEILAALRNSGLQQAQAMADTFDTQEYQSKTPLDMLKQIVNNFGATTQDMIGLTGLELYEIEDALPAIQQKLKHTFDLMMSNMQDQAQAPAAQTTTATQNTTSSTSSLTVDAAVQRMRQTGGEMEVNGKKGLVVEIFYDSQAGKLRARTNDGQHGLMNARFPNSYRERDAVFVVPKWDVSLANKCYAISNTVPLSNYRVR